MDGSTLSIVLIPVVVVISLAAWLIMVAYAASHPTWKHGLGSRQGEGTTPPPAAQNPPPGTQISPSRTEIPTPRPEIPRPRTETPGPAPAPTGTKPLAPAAHANGSGQ